LSDYVLKLFEISDRMEMKFSVDFDFTTTIKLILIIANFHSMILLTAALHSLITEVAGKFKL